MEEGGHLRASDSMRIKMLLEIFNYRGFEVEVAEHSAILNTLSCERNLSQHSQLFATKTELFTTDICHLDPKFHYKMMINVGTVWFWEE